MNNTGFFDRVYKIVATIPYGRVMTYGQIAKLIGNPRGARIVGWALHSNTSPQTVPCHRVVNSKGEISSGYAFGGKNEQQKLLENEGIEFDKCNKINLEKFLWV